jgi:hypothetical protein
LVHGKWMGQDSSGREISFPPSTIRKKIVQEGEEDLVFFFNFLRLFLLLSLYKARRLRGG